ncbi:class I SAM-dependent DNA methyltransferase, partial [bacterium]|nr:class I SAM-dependent DNA methyltransferase [bacterium]
MEKSSAVRIVRQTFQNPFDKESFVYFIKSLLNHIELAPFIYRGNFIPDAYKPYIKTLERIGKYQDKDGKKIDLLIVHLKKETSLERARTMQRNFIAWYLNGSRGNVLKDAALVAFVSPDSDDWRFSLVKMDYRLDASGEKVRIRQELTPARRFSFLVGKNESSHTAQSRLVPILQDDSRDPTLRDLEEAFSVEKVTKEFFEKYRQLFHKVKEALDEIVKKDKKVRHDFKKKNIDTVNFAKKLLGQIVFLYFLQKKGWFGVERDKDWGTGPKNFLRLLFEKEIINYDNFFNDVLEPLFYNTLAVERTDDYSDRFNCKIPFLNGGLFDPLNNYDWVHTDILLPNELFSNNVKTKEGDIGTGILDIFDRYNFTVKEDEPLEKEVAVDPEMLGKVFENLLEVKDRKSKGTYYTPREIVHYMCQQSLINYLKTECSDIEGKKIESLINPKVITKKDYQKFRKSGGRKEQVIEGAILLLWEKEAEELDKKLKTIRICDPACGSGAFLVGMMQEIISARKRLNFILNREIDSYELKRHTIQNCLYGVDIDPGAVEIAKLRLWLSLVVDEK